MSRRHHSVVRFATAIVFTVIVAAVSQGNETSTAGELVYRLASPSVFLVETRSASGGLLSQGTAFVVGPNTLLSNAHVISGSKPFVVSGGLAVECRVLRADYTNDLVLLAIAGELAAPALRLATHNPEPGAPVYIVANPSGLERTISSGLFTGSRRGAGRELLQVSAPASPGSSGGPLLNSAGEVVGVVTLSLPDAQNINFAIPLEVVERFLNATSENETTNAFAALERLEAEQLDLPYSEDEDSPWQRTQTEINRILADAARDLPDDAKLLAGLASAAELNDVEIAGRSARRALVKSSALSSADLFRLSEVLHTVSQHEADDAKRVSLARDALLASERATRKGGQPNCKQQHILGALEKTAGRREAAIRRWQGMLTSCPTNVDDVLWSLCSDAIERKSRDEATAYFDRLRAMSTPTAEHYQAFATFLSSLNDHRAAARAYLQAADTLDDHPERFRALCAAATSFWSAQELELHVRAARMCIELGMQIEDSETTVATAHRLLASSLIKRGVYEEAIGHAKSAIAIASNDAWAYHYLATAYDELERNTEAVQAAKAAIRLSDGRWPEMHSTLGSAYFDLENWSLSRAAYMKSAELDAQDWVAPYNVALCYIREGYTDDAASWLEEVLRRNPDHRDRDGIRIRIKQLRQ